MSDCVQWRDEDVHDVAVHTEGFSFPYLKELMINAMMTQNSAEEVPFTQHVSEQLE